MLRWPQGKRVGVFVNIVLEGWTENEAPGVGPMGNPLRPGVRDTQAVSWAEYGPKVGAERLLRIVQDEEVHSTVLTSGIVAQRFPQLVKSIVDNGHEVCAHSMAQDIIPACLTEEEDWQNIVDCVGAIGDATGTRPLGWCSPRCTPGPRTVEFLAKLGFSWHADVFDSDMPYVQETHAGPIIAIPFGMEVNDMPLYVRYGNPPETFTSVLERLLDEWFEKEPDERGFLDVSAHAHVFGRPIGAVEYRRAIKMIKSKPWIWIPTHKEVVEAMTTERECPDLGTEEDDRAKRQG